MHQSYAGIKLWNSVETGGREIFQVCIINTQTQSALLTT